jgi:hypothetical protein
VEQKRDCFFARGNRQSQLAAALFLSPHKGRQQTIQAYLFDSARLFIRIIVLIHTWIATATSVYLFWANTIARSWSLGENDAKFICVDGVSFFISPSLSHM